MRSVYFWRQDGAVNRRELPIPLVNAIDAFAYGAALAMRDDLKKKQKKE